MYEFNLSDRNAALVTRQERAERRRAQVAAFLEADKTIAEMARELGVSRETIRRDIQRITSQK